MNSVVVTTQKSHILYDAALMDQSGDELFEADSWLAAGRLEIASAGRGTTFFILRPQGDWVLRHYRRGGLMARMSSDGYLWLGLDSTRPWREWRLLAALYGMGLPVPRPVAARVSRRGMQYQGDLITERLDAAPLSSLAGAGAPVDWSAVGACLRRFHDAGVYHADLNAHNILISAEGRPYLIDFDRGRFRSDGAWKHHNLRRLRRSLDKLKAQNPDFAFETSDWVRLTDAYAGAL